MEFKTSRKKPGECSAEQWGPQGWQKCFSRLNLLNESSSQRPCPHKSLFWTQLTDGLRISRFSLRTPLLTHHLTYRHSWAVLPGGKETSRFSLPFKTRAGLPQFLIIDITLLIYSSFAEARSSDLNWLFIACFKRELGFASRGQLSFLLQGVIIFMAQAEAIGHSKLNLDGRAL